MGCEACVAECPHQALYMNDEGQCNVLENDCVDCGQCVDVCPVAAISLPQRAESKEQSNNTSDKNVISENKTEEKAVKLEGDLSKYQGVWVFIEQREGEIASVSLELLGAGRELADKLGVELSGVLLGSEIADKANNLYQYGADKVYLLEHPGLKYYRTETYMQNFVQLVQKYNPEVILMGATTTGRDLAGAVATDLGTGLTADCTALDIDPEERLLLATRPAFGGNIMATIVSKKHRPQMATVRSKVMKMPKPIFEQQGELVKVDVEIDESQLLTKVREIVQQAGDKVNLQDAEIIVAGGRGLGDGDNFKVCYDLAKSIGAQVGASRAAVEAGWIDHKYQVGQTGVTVAPKIYIALGISGAIQHLVGIRGSDIIIAVNTDPEAPIFKECTYGIVGDALEIAPLLKQPLQQLLADKKAS